MLGQSTNLIILFYREVVTNYVIGTTYKSYKYRPAGYKNSQPFKSYKYRPAGYKNSQPFKSYKYRPAGYKPRIQTRARASRKDCTCNMVRLLARGGARLKLELPNISFARCRLVEEARLYNRPFYHLELGILTRKKTMSSVLPLNWT